MTSPPCCSAGSGARRWAPRWPTCSSAPPSPGVACPPRIPMRLEHSPSHANFPGENGELRYGEGLFMGYRGYEHNAIAPRFAFGHGLSYTSFDRRADAVDGHLPARRDADRLRTGHQYGLARRVRGRAVLCRAGSRRASRARRRSSRPSPRSGSSRARRRRWISCSRAVRSPTGTRVRTTGRTCRHSCPRCSTSSRPRPTPRAGMAGRRRFLRHSYRPVVRGHPCQLHGSGTRRHKLEIGSNHVAQHPIGEGKSREGAPRGAASRKGGAMGTRTSIWAGAAALVTLLGSTLAFSPARRGTSPADQGVTAKTIAVGLPM